MIRIARAGLGVLLTMCALVARADEAKIDRVLLDDDRSIYGTISEIVPEDRLTIRSLRGKTVTIPWVRVRRIERDVAPPAQLEAAPAPSTEPAPPTSAEPAPTAPPAPKPPAPKRVREAQVALVHVVTTSAVDVERRGTPFESWKVVCVSPCDAKLPLDGEYRINGDGVQTSVGFSLEARAGQRVDLNVQPGSSTALGFGTVLTVTGGVVGLAGLMALGNNDAHGDSTPGTAALVVGLAVAGFGAIIVSASPRTRVSQNVVGAASASPPLLGFRF